MRQPKHGDLVIICRCPKCSVIELCVSSKYIHEYCKSVLSVLVHCFFAVVFSLRVLFRFNLPPKYSNKDSNHDGGLSVAWVGFYFCYLHANLHAKNIRCHILKAKGQEYWKRNDYSCDPFIIQRIACSFSFLPPEGITSQISVVLLTGDLFSCIYSSQRLASLGDHIFLWNTCTVNVDIFALYIFLKYPRKYVPLENYFFNTKKQPDMLKTRILIHANLSISWFHENVYTRKYQRSQYSGKKLMKFVKGGCHKHGRWVTPVVPLCQARRKNIPS